MSVSLKYKKITGHYYCQHSDDWEQDGVDFEYQVPNYRLLPVIIDLVFDDYFCDTDIISDDEEITKAIKQKLKTLIDENDMIEILAENYEETLTEIFAEEAFEWYNG
jgi:hypothetical protein